MFLMWVLTVLDGDLPVGLAGGQQNEYLQLALAQGLGESYTRWRELMRKVDAAFFRTAEARGGTMVKYQLEEPRLPSLGEVREKLGQAGLDVEGLELEGRLRFVMEGSEPGNRVEEVQRLAEEESGEGHSVWISMNWDLRMGVEEALEQQQALTELVEGSELVVKTTVLEDDLDEWPGADQRRAQVMHSGTLWLAREGLALSRVSPALEL
jgi:hypothetical protein